MTLTVIPEMWELMERSFSGEDPPFDLVGVDDLLLSQAARAGHVEPLDDLIAADGYSLDDFRAAGARRAERRRPGLGPALLLCVERPDLPGRPLRALRHRGPADARRADRRGARGPGGGARRRQRATSTGSRSAARQTAGSTSGWSARPGGRRSARAGTTTRASRRSTRRSCVRRRRALRRARPPRRAARVADDGLHGLHGLLRRRPRCDDDRARERGLDPLRRGRRGGGRHADGADPGRPARAAGTQGCTRRPTRSPRSRAPRRRHGSSRSSSARPSRCSRTPSSSGFVEVARNSVLARPRLRRPLPARAPGDDRRGRGAFARGERPVTRFGMEVGNRIGDEIVRVLTGELGAREAMAEAERTVAALGPPQ